MNDINSTEYPREDIDLTSEDTNLFIAGNESYLVCDVTDFGEIETKKTNKNKKEAKPK